MEAVTKYRYAIHDVQVEEGKDFYTFEFQLPSNLKRIVGITVTNTVNQDLPGTAGTLALQSQDETDVFLQCVVIRDDLWEDNALGAVEFYFLPYLDFTYLAGWRWQEIPVTVTNKTAVVNGWYRSHQTNASYRVRIYIRYEEGEGA